MEEFKAQLIELLKTDKEVREWIVSIIEDAKDEENAAEARAWT